MITKRRLMPLLVALLVWGSNSASSESSSPASETPSKASVMIDEAGSRKSISSSPREKSREPPGSPVNLFMPDEFQFYTLNGNGQLVMKQMTKQEIQGMIAAGGTGGLPVDVGQHQTQLPDAEPKVSDVVQNVQKVLKSELNKPVPVHSLSSSIPGSVNTQWTNMLPYILSGGSLDQQDVSQDSSILLPSLDNDETYIDVVPLNAKLPDSQYDQENNYVQLRPTTQDQEIKVITLKPHSDASEKPIYLLGNMALDSDILGEQESYTLPTKGRPSRPSVTTVYQKHATKQPPLASGLKDSIIDLKNSSNSKPTLYIPLSVSPSLLADSQNQDNYGSLDVHIIPGSIPKPIIHHHKNLTKLPSFGPTTTTTTTNESGSTRVTMMKVPLIPLDEINSSTTRANSQTTMSPGTATSTTMRHTSYPTKINIGPIGGFKKPATIYRPSTSYRPMYEPLNKHSTVSLFGLTSSPRPVYETEVKPTTVKTSSSTYHPVYRPAIKSTTEQFVSSTYRPIYEGVTKPNVYTAKPIISRRPIYETSTKLSEVTKFPIYTYTSKKSSTPVIEVATKATTPSEEFKVTKYPSDETPNTEKKSSPVNDIVTKPTTQKVVSEVTKYTASAEDTTIVSKEGFVHVKYPPIPSESLSAETSEVNKNEPTTADDNQTTITNVDTTVTDKILDDNTDINEFIKYSYSTVKNNESTDSINVPSKTETELPSTINYTTEETTQTQVDDINTSSEKVDEITTIDDALLKTTDTEQSDKSAAENNYNSYTTVEQESTPKEPEIILKESDDLLTSVAETKIPNYEPTTIKQSLDNELNYQSPSVLEESKERNKIVTTTVSEKGTTDKFEQSQSWTESTQFVPTDTVEYKEPTINREDSTVVTQKDITTDKAEYSTIDYSLPTTVSDKAENENLNFKGSTNENKIIKPMDDDDESTIGTLEYSTILPSTIKELDKITTLSSNYESKTDVKDAKPSTGYYIRDNQNTEYSTQTTYQTETYESTIPVTELSVNNNQTKTTADNISITENILVQSDNNEVKKDSVTPIYEKVNTITENAPLIESMKQPIVLNTETKTISLQEEEMSTVKVIPVYDDDAVIYTLPSGYKNKITSSTSSPNASTEEKIPEKSANKDKPYKVTNYVNTILTKTTQSLKPTDQQFESNSQRNSEKTVPSSIALTTPSYTTQNDYTSDTVLPGLEETFNNYMKEHYNPNLSNTDNYDEISHLTTFPTINREDILSFKNKISTLPSTIFDYTTDPPKFQNNPQLSEIKPLSTSNDKITTLIFTEKPEYTTKVPDIKVTTEYFEEKETTYITSKPGTNKENNKNDIETPIIYLDLVTPDTDNPSTPSTTNKDNMSNSSLTRIKIKNPLYDIDKILLEAPSPTNTPPTISYTLPSDYKPPNNIASGLIAGYPTYNEGKPIVEYVPGTTIYDIISGTNKPTTTSETVSQIIKDKETETDKSDSYPVKPITLLPIDEKYLQNKTTTPVFTTQDELTTTYNDQTTLNPTTQIPIESIPITNKSKPPSQTEQNFDEINSSFNPPLEKISDLINQLQYSPTQQNPMGYDYSNGIMTTIVPSDRFETVPYKTKPTTNDILTTIYENLGETYPKLQTTTSKPYQSSTKPPTYRITTKEPVTVKSTTRSSTKITTRPTIYRTTTKTPSTLKTTTSNAPKFNSKPTVYYTTTKGSSLIKTTISSTTNFSTKVANTTKSSTTPSIKNKLSSNSTTVATTVRQSTTARPLTTTISTTKAAYEKVQSTIDKSAGRINLEEEKNKLQPTKPTEVPKYTMKNKNHYITSRRPGGEYVGFTRKTTKPVNKPTATTIKDHTTPKTTSVTKDTEADKWTVIPQKDIADQNTEAKPSVNVKDGNHQTNPQIVTLEHNTGAIGLDQSNKGLDKDVAEFLNMCNELSFKFWTLSNAGLNPSRSITMSPFGMISTLAMIFLGARGLTSNQMNDILKLDDVVTFNPHLVFQNITDTVTLARGQGIQNAAFVRALFADRLKVRKIMPFYKEQAQQFYEGAVVDISFSMAGDILRRRTNLLIRKQTGGRIKDFVKSHTVPLRSPLTALSANVFETSCDSPDASSEGRDGEMYFAVSQTVKQRKLVPIPAVVWKSGVSAGYEPSLDATAIALGDPKRPVSMIMVMPGQQGLTAPGDNLERLEQRLFGNPSDNALEKLLKVIVPRRLEVQMPKFSHHSIVNVTNALKKMGFDQLFTKTADLKGINGAGHDLFLADMVQMNLFCTCGDDNKFGGQHLSETYPGTSTRHTRAWEVLNNNNNNNNGLTYDLDNKKSDTSEPSDSNECEEEEEEDNNQDWTNSDGGTDGEDSLKMRNSREKLLKKRLRWITPTRRRRCRHRRQADPEKPRMKMDKPFLYLIRHNLTGLILHIGRFSPKNQS